MSEIVQENTRIIPDRQTNLTKKQREAVGLLSIGTFLEYFDLMLYVHMAVLLNDLFFETTDPKTSSLMAAFAFCSTYLLRPFGALVFGWIGDNIGRKVTVIITTFMMAFSCFVMANLPTYAQIGVVASYLVTICRILQGMSSMGELVGAQLYLTEITRPPIQYPVVTLTSVFSILGGTFALAIASLSTLYGFNWRGAFWFGVVVALIGVVARTTLKETPDFADAKRRVTNTLNNSQKKELKNNIIWNEDKNKDKKTFLFLFLMDCGWPVCFYFTYVFCGNILKQDFGFTTEQVIHQNFIVSIIQLIGMIILSFISYKVYPPKIIKTKLWLFIATILLCPFLIIMVHNSYTIFVIQCCSILFACDYVPARPITYKHVSIFRRFTYCSMSYGLSRPIMYIVTSFGLIYLFEYLGYLGLLIIIIPIIISYALSISYFDKLEKEAGSYH
jgi:MFS transporter, MHS family, proline/betaine transporter